MVSTLGMVCMVCGYIRRVCNSGIPDAFYLVKPESGLLYACQTFIENCGLSPRVWVPYSGHSSRVHLESSSREALQHLKTVAWCISSGLHLPEVPGLDLLHSFITGAVLFPGEGL